MPPKKLPSKLTSQGSLAIPVTPAAPTARLPLPSPILPASETIAPLWAPTTPPVAVFPEWPASDTFAPEHWHSLDAPFDDPLPLSELQLPFEVRRQRESIQWKRPRDFLPPIVDPTPSAPPQLAVVHADPKSAKKAAAAPPKKAEADKKAPPPAVPPKHAHIFYVDTKAASDRSPPATPDPHHKTRQHRILRDFRRLWSAEQLDALEQWRREEARVEMDTQQRERVLMAFEDAIAYIVNERPRGMLDDVDIDPEDLVDDGHDDDPSDEHLDSGGGAGGSDASPWGVLPPAPIHIQPNSVMKPESPHGEVVHADMASYFRLVEQLFNAWQLSDSPQASQHVSARAGPFLWRAIHPQDANGLPVYNPGGKYSVKLFVLGKWRRIDIDDRLPVDSSGKIVYACSSMASEIWPALLTKALYKAMQWLQVSGCDGDGRGSDDDATYATRVAAQTLLLLTGWKVSTWSPGATTSFSENAYHQLLPFVPPQQQRRDSDRSIAHEDSDAHEGGEPTQEGTSEPRQLPADDAIVVDEVESAQPLPSDGDCAPQRKPRALICCADASNAAARSPLRFCEAAVLTDIVGDSGNTTFKIVRHGAPANISEDGAGTASANANSAFVLLLVHPPPAQAASVTHTWAEAASGEGEHLVPFENPRVAFALVKLPVKKEKLDEHDQEDGEDDEDDEEAERSSVVATLTPVHGRRGAAASAAPESPSSSASRAVAKLLRLDPRGSVSLVEEPTGAIEAGAAPPPTLVTLDTTSSSLFDLEPVDAAEKAMRAFRVVPQRSLVRYGYCLEIESRSVASVELVDAAGLWRALGHLHVQEAEGTYPVLLPHTWNVLVQQVLTVDPGDRDKTQQGECQEIELRVDLHVSDAELSRFLHVSLVHHATNAVTLLPALSCAASIPLAQFTEAPAFTVIVDCAPGAQPIRAGSWHLTLGCARKFGLAPTPAGAMSVTTFGGVYEPNRELVLFRDVLAPAAKAVASSFQLEVLEEGGRVVHELAVQLEVFDTGNGGDGDATPPPLVQVRGKGAARLLQLPRPPSVSRLVLQASIDRSACEVPVSLQSRRPFRSSTAQPPPGAAPSVETAIDEASDPESGEALLEGGPTAKTAGLQWRLRCWSAEEVKMDVDRARELRHEAIRARWAEQARDRETSGAASRLLFLGDQAAAEARLQHEPSLNEERAEALRGRFAWLRQVLDRVEASERRLLGTSRMDGEDVAVVGREELESHERELAEQLRLAHEQLEQRRAARAAAKEQRAAQWTADVHRVVDERAAAAKQRAARRQELLDASTASA